MTPQEIKAKVLEEQAGYERGGLREKIKAGDCKASDVLVWLKRRPGPHSKKFIGWLRRRS